MQSDLDINYLAREAQTRWLKPVEVFSILRNYEEHQLTHQVPQKPTSGSLYLFNKRVLKFFRKDGHKWRRRKDQRTIAEAHERLKVGNTEALNCYYAHGEENYNFQRRSYWMLDPAYDHIVLVHYRDIGEGRQNARPISQFSPLYSTFSPSTSSFATHQLESSFVNSGVSHSIFSPNSVEMNSCEVESNHAMNLLNLTERTEEVNSASGSEMNQALQMIKHQLSLNDDEVPDYNQYSNDLEDVLHDYDVFGPINDSDILILQQHSDRIQQQNQLSGIEVDVWKDLLDDTKKLPVSQAQDGGQYAEMSSHMIPHGYPSFLDQYELEIPHEDNINLTIAPRQKFTIKEISPDWCYASEGAKVIVVGLFLCDQFERSWACMFGDTEVPVQIIQEGVLCCQAPPFLQGKVTLCITSGNRESCSEVREFEYRPKPSVCVHSNSPEAEASRSSEELLSLASLVHMLLSDSQTKGDISESRSAEDPLSQIIDTLVVTATPSTTLDLLLQELLKDKVKSWLSSKAEKNNQSDCSLSKKEQGIIHLVAGLGFQWALQPILNAGVNVNFRDFHGWTALHWAAKFGREKMVAALIASGALPGAVTDPNTQDRTGQTPASIAATYGHKGLAGYLSELSLTNHLSSLTLEENELSKGSAAVEAERTVNGLSHTSSSTYADQVSLKHTLAAVRNATQAAARIQAAFRAHSFHKRQQREAADTIAHAGEDNYIILESDIRGLSTASKSTFRHGRDHHVAALSIQKNYRSWKGRTNFLAIRQKVVKIQAHVRGYQVRKNYRISWAVGILEKAILRWRRRGVGLRGYRNDPELIDESDDAEVIKVFRKTKVDAAIAEAVSRVLSMVESPTACQQYHRLLEKYRQAKAELNRSGSDSATSSDDVSVKK